MVVQHTNKRKDRDICSVIIARFRFKNKKKKIGMIKLLENGAFPTVVFLCFENFSGLWKIYAWIDGMTRSDNVREHLH